MANVPSRVGRHWDRRNREVRHIPNGYLIISTGVNRDEDNRSFGERNILSDENGIAILFPERPPVGEREGVGQRGNGRGPQRRGQGTE